MRNQRGQFVKGHSSSPDTEFKLGEHWRKPKEHWNKEWLYRKYVIEKLSCGDIAKLQGCTETNITYWMRKHGIKRRTVSEARKVKHWGSPGETNGMFGANGKDNPNWKGGISPERQELYSSMEWKQASKQARERDQNQCQRCGVAHSVENKLHLHHIEGFENKEKRTDPRNLVLLCKGCHGWVHSKENVEKQFKENGTAKE